MSQAGPNPQTDGPPSPRPQPPAGERAGPLAPSQSERSAAARARGLSAPSIAGGRDPEPDEGLREERYYGRLLIIMVAIIVLSGFILGIVANLIGMAGGG